LRLAREEAKRIEEEKIREQKRLEAERLEAERIRKEERIREQKKREQERLEAENKRRQEIHDKRAPILQDKSIGDMILAKKNFASKLRNAIIGEIDHDDYNTLKVYFIYGPDSLDKLLTVSWHEVGIETWSKLSTDLKKLIIQDPTLSELISCPEVIKQLNQTALTAFEKHEVAILNKVDARENEILRHKQEEKEAKDNRLSVYKNCEIGNIVACKNNGWLDWEFGYLNWKGKDHDGSEIKIRRPGRSSDTYHQVRELTEAERDQIFRDWPDKPREQFLDLFLEQERLEAFEFESRGEQPLSEKTTIASRSTRRRDVPFNPFSPHAVEERNRRQAERAKARRRESLEDFPEEAQEKLSKNPKTTNKKTKPKLTQEEIEAVRKKGRDKYQATKAQKPSVIKKTNSAKPLKSSPEIDELKDDISQLEAMINIEQKKIDSKNSRKTVISNARGLKSRYAKRLREKKAKLDKLLKELDEKND
jgi:hypothetical protein